MNGQSLLALRSGQAMPRARIPQLPLPEFQRAITAGVAAGQRVAAAAEESSR